MAGERTTQVNLWVRQHITDYDTPDDGLDVAAACVAAMEHFNAIPGFWKEWIAENLVEVIGDIVGRTLHDASRGKTRLGDADLPGQPSAIDAATEPASKRLLDQLQRRMKRATVADLLNGMDLKARKWEQHYELVDERRKVLFLDMTRADYGAAIEIRKKASGTQVAMVALMELIRSTITDEQRGRDRFTEAQLTTLFESMGAASARPATQPERMVAD
jgi:hypothetical protein